jgi:peptidoglycan hydrolase-like protein with peptidoglycan-binding domain
VSDELIRQWAGQGLLGPAAPLPIRILTIGDRGPEVARVQRRLNQDGTVLKVDGIFGPGTRAAVAEFQAAHGLLPDGVVGPETAKVIGLA